jgi:hypothetical protein
LDPRDFIPFPSQKQGFEVLLSGNVRAAQIHPDKSQLLETILMLRGIGMSFREIGKTLSIDSSHVWQIVNHYTQEHKLG